MEIIFLIGIIESLFFGSILLVKRNKTKSDKILMFWLLIICLHLFFPLLIYKNYPKNIYLSGVDSSLFVLHAIFLYIYTNSLITRSKGEKIKINLHLVAFIISSLAVIPYVIIDKELKIAFYEKNSELPVIVWLSSGLINLIFLLYLLATIMLIIKHKKSLKDDFSYFKQLELNWLKYLSIGLLIIYFSLTIVGSALYAVSIAIYNIDYFIYVLLVVFVFGLGFYGIKQQNVFSDINNIRDKELNTKTEKNNTQLKISDEETEFSKMLLEYMKKERLYLKNDLSLYDLAERLKVKPYYISYIINNVLNTNFYEFVNTYRVKEMKNQLKLNISNFTILGIALESGFNSKSTANRIFKEYTGITPSQYINSIMSHSIN